MKNRAVVATTDTTIHKTMSKELKIVRCEDSLAKAFHIMKLESIRHLPVVDREGRLVGIISDRDIRHSLWSSDMRDSHGYPEDPFFSQGKRVQDCMSYSVKTLPENSDLLSAVEIMIHEKISAVLITKGDEVTGIITHEDLLKVLQYFLKGHESFSQKVFSLAYNSPLNTISTFLAGAGI